MVVWIKIYTYTFLVVTKVQIFHSEYISLCRVIYAVVTIYGTISDICCLYIDLIVSVEHLSSEHK